MKKLVLIAAAAAAVLASCTNGNNENVPTNTGETPLVIKLSGVKPAEVATRAEQAAGVTGLLQMNDGHIFVINAATGVVIAEEPIVVADATGSGHILGGASPKVVPSNALVYVLANIPSDIAPATLTTWAAIQAAASALANNTDYTDAMMANSTGVGSTITPGADKTGSVSIALSPLYSRLELHNVKGSGNIVSYDVTGVFVDDYYPEFTMVGAGAGTLFEQGISTTFTGIGDTGSWSSASLVAAPAASNVWAYHVPAEGLPRLIVRMENVVYDKDPSSAVNLETITGVRYITIANYQPELIEFERGKIYRIGAVAGSELKFDEDDLTLVPGAVTDIEELTVTATVEDWVLEDLKPEL
ncbi:MAG: hypothetical protein LBV18_04350 [Alistipes sp.]|jgi:hypothetical protein|nr:hypothetical protein [Alistipes sp.]